MEALLLIAQACNKDLSIEHPPPDTLPPDANLLYLARRYQAEAHTRETVAACIIEKVEAKAHLRAEKSALAKQRKELADAERQAAKDRAAERQQNWVLAANEVEMGEVWLR